MTDEPIPGRTCPPCDGICCGGLYCPKHTFGEPVSWSLLLAIVALLIVSAWDAVAKRCAAVWRQIRPKSRYEWLALGSLLSWAACLAYIAVVLTATLFK